MGDLHDLPEPQRAYAQRLAKQRLHQPAFRTRVLLAYDTRCTVCSLHHGALLDAAHIVPDTELGGIPTTPNGLALCKIHHAAYDQNMLVAGPDYKVAINREVLAEVDGPMLKHGLHEMHGRTITLPGRAGGSAGQGPARMAVGEVRGVGRQTAAPAQEETR